MATLRNLKIKTSSCKRIVKELHSYEREIEREAAKTADMKEKGADPYDLKQQLGSGDVDPMIAGHMCLVIGEIPEFVVVGFALENVLAESRMMIPDCRKRLEATLADLKGILDELEELNQKEGPEFSEAQSTIADVEMLFQKIEA
ncbi:hypothetical protein RJ639_040209 [Escallonia herrerae]|uniref:Tubulin-specific chaperone A n=1 Tax=Escallonia herrerae TaxID=1293975 RepID=A0AA89B9Z6_9ASTE|nr:hypothetical protein RJ639_040209 [Escallonia herrerae]